MTNIGDVVRQVETAMCDTQYPPTPEELEVFNRVLHAVCIGAREAGGSR
jgi:hypothetical protein